MSSPRTIAALIFPEAMILDAAGPLQVFASANRERARTGQPRAYDVVLVAAGAAGPVATSSGMRLHADLALSDLDPAAVDTLLIAGGDGVDAVAADPAVLARLRALEPRLRRLGSVCSGALVLAAAGLLDGRVATTHWARAEELAARHPAVRVEANRLHTYAPGAHLFTSAGVTAGIDLALALVEDDLGPDVARAVARRLVMFLKRPGGQAQFSAHLAPDLERLPRLADLLAWLPGNLDADLSLEALAERCAMTPRTFSRVFAKRVGVSPARYVERVRVEAARLQLEASDRSIGVIARACGFGHPETLRRAFQRQMGVSPQDYAQRFGRQSAG